MNCYVKRIISTVMCVAFTMAMVPYAKVNAQDSMDILAKFSFEQLDYTDEALNDTYGGSADRGYSATSGILKDSSTVYASVNGSDKKKIEWSNFEGADGNDYKDSDGNLIGAVPVMAAGSNHQWADVSTYPPYFEIVTTTEGYNGITFTAELGGSNKGAKNFALSYSLNGIDFTDIENAAYTISKKKTMEKAFDKLVLPDDANNAKKLYLRLYATSDETIGGAVLGDNPTGGETAINNICLKGTSISGEKIWQPAFEIINARLENDILYIDNKNISAQSYRAVNIVSLYKDSELVKVFVGVIDELAENKKQSVGYSVEGIDFDNIKTFIWEDVEGVKPLGYAKEYVKVDITADDKTEEDGDCSNEPAYQDIPVVELTGDITDISRDNWKDVTISYKSATEEFTSYASVKWQGRSSVSQGYPKYNYSLKMYTDEERTTKDKHQFRDWLPAHNYCLKANWIDSTHARNIVSARLAEKIQKTPLPTGASGVIDGFPVHIYLNGKDQGIYTWNIPKKDWTFGMDPDNPDHIVFGAEQQKGACLFQNKSSSDSDWELVCPDDTGTEREKLNRLITFVMDSSIEEFKANFNNYLNFDSVLDYYVFAHIIGHTDGYAKNMLLATFDGKIWYTSLYDMDSTYGLYWTGKKRVGADVLVSETNTDNELYRVSNLWSKFEQAFGDEIYARYIELRANELSDENILAEFQYFIDGVGQDLYDLDESVWHNVSDKHPDIPSLKYRLDQIEQFLIEREPYTRAWMESLRQSN